MSAEQYHYRCCLDGSVKAYKKMTCQKAEAINQELGKRGAHGRWVPTMGDALVRHASDYAMLEPHKTSVTTTGVAFSVPEDPYTLIY